jgi:hypothetical protein
MILGMSLATYTFLHVLISLVGIGSGLVVMYGFLTGRLLNGWTGLFLATTVLTSLTGYGFPVQHIKPSHIVGGISLVVLAIAIAALYLRHLAGAWRRTYVITAMIALYLNVFVLVAQSFDKVPGLRALAPTQSEPPFLFAQLLVMALFIVLTVFAAKRFRAEDKAFPHARAA